MLFNNKDYGHIPGWGVDADYKEEPGRQFIDGSKSVDGESWEPPPQQLSVKEILHSNERPRKTAVFGTTLPPRGLSGTIRRFAFKYSESKLQHWLLLLLADRINVVEGTIEDITKGHIPNLLAEKGYKAKLKHNSKGVIKDGLKALIFLGITAMLINQATVGKKDRSIK
jgi:hypothetical protein